MIIWKAENLNMFLTTQQAAIDMAVTSMSEGFEVREICPTILVIRGEHHRTKQPLVAIVSAVLVHE